MFFTSEARRKNSRPSPWRVSSQSRRRAEHQLGRGSRRRIDHELELELEMHRGALGELERLVRPHEQGLGTGVHQPGCALTAEAALGREPRHGARGPHAPEAASLAVAVQQPGTQQVVAGVLPRARGDASGHGQQRAQHERGQGHRPLAVCPAEDQHVGRPVAPCRSADDPLPHVPLAGDALLAHAAANEMVVTLADAVVRRTTLGAAGRPDDRTLAHAAAIVGDVLGWSWLCPPRQWHLGAETREPVRAWMFDAAAVRDLCAARPALGLALVTLVAETIGERLRATRTRLLDLYGAPESGRTP